MSRDALVVGINKYPFLKDSATGNYKHLTTPATDAEAIAQLLETHGNFRVKRFPASNIDGKLQVDPDKLVKTEELEAAILDLFLPESGKPPETALLFFAGHGLRKQLRQSLTQGFLGTSDASPSKNLWGLSLRELWEILQQSQAQQQVIWLDCCFSGELLNFKDTELGRHSSGCDRFLIAASRDYEVAYQQLDGKHGVLTGALLAGLNPHLVPEFEWITNRTLTVSVEQKLQGYYETTKIPQSPLISNHGEAIKLIQGRAKPHSQNQSDAKNFQNLRLEPHTINELVKLLRPFLEDERNRRPFLVLALGNDEPVLQHISWGGAVAIFIPDMVCKLADYGEVAPGKQALWALLEYVRSQVGIDVQQRIDNLRPLLEVRSRSDSFGVSPSSTATDTTSIDVLVQKVRSCLDDDMQRLHGTMPLLGVDHWVDLGELFVDVNILEQVSSSRKLELDDLLQDFSAGVKEYSSYRSLDRIGLGKQQQRVSGLTVLEKNTNLMVLGKPGSGKTTYLQRIVTECNEGRLQPQRIPVLIKLRYFVDDGRKFEYSLEAYLTQHWRLSDAEAELVLNQGRALILLDGLDEVAGICGQEISKQIKQFSRTYPQNQLIVTCRMQSQESRFERFDYIEVADFNEKQVNAFAKHYFKVVCSNTKEGEGKAKARQFLEKLYLEENKTIRELVITPILLNLTCSVFHQTEKFYSKRSKLYEEGLELLLAKWDKSREIERDEIYRDLSVERKRELLSYLAVKKFEQQQYILFEQEEIEGYIAEFLDIPQSDTRVVLKAIEAQHGLLIQRSETVWSFSHLTFQEYLVAKYVNNNNLTPESVFTYLSIHITNLWWHEIFILIVEILKDPDAFIKLFKKEVDGIIVTDNKLQQILTWTIEMHTNILGGYSLSSIRAAYIDIIQAISDEYYSQPNSKQNRTIFSTLAGAILSHIPNEFSIYGVDHESGFPRSFQGNKILANILICALDFGRVPTLGNFDGIRKYIDQFLDAYNHDDELQEIIYKIKNNLDDLNTVTDKEEARLEILAIWWQTNGKTWITQLRNSMITYRNIGHDWQLSNQQKLQLKHYYKANQLLINCLNSNGRVSNQVRKEIEETLLLPITEIEKRERDRSDIRLH
jgi:Effector-associated domain 8/NACHT domain/Caspase domain